MSARLQVLVVDDTITYRNILKRAVAEIPGAEVVGVAPTGEIALDKIRLLGPNMVLLDIEMPHMDGLQALELIRQYHPKVGVVMVSATTRRAVDSTIKALELGALDFIRKPEGSQAEDNIAYIRQHLTGIFDEFSKFTPTLPRRAKVRTVRVRKRFRPGATRKNIPEKTDLIVIGCSTGGPTALMQLMPQLPADCPVPVVVVQHMPAGFTASLCRNLDEKSGVTVVEAVPGDTLKPGHVYMAPGGRHLEIVRRKNGMLVEYCTRITNRPPVNNCKPSIDITFRSVSESFRGNVLALILTGMGADGTAGVKALKQRGDCYCITQAAESCVVYGMPRAVDREGLSDVSLPLEAIGLRINTMIAEGRRAHASV